MMEKVYREGHQIPFFQCDSHKRLKLSAANAYFAEIAGWAFRKRGLTHEMLWERGFVFLVSKIHIRFFQPVQAYDVIEMRTWEKEIRGAAFVRDFEAVNEKGEVLFSATSDWIAVDPLTRKIHRPSEFFGEGNFFQKEIGVENCKRLRMYEGEPLGELKVLYSHLDANGHLHNATYADLILDVLPKEYRDRFVTDYEMNYLHEAKEGEEIRFLGHFEGDTVMVKGLLQERECFIAKLTFAPLP